nr:DNA-binding protein HEXBP-like [Nicotiana tomentosiformis]
MEREGNNKGRSAGNFGGYSGSGGGRSVIKGGSTGPSKYSGNRGSYQQGRSSGRFQQQRRPPCPRCGKMHFGAYFIDQPICYVCGMMGHIQRDCRSSNKSMGMGVAQLASSAVTTSATPPPARETPAHAWAWCS